MLLKIKNYPVSEKAKIEAFAVANNCQLTEKKINGYVWPVMHFELEQLPDLLAAFPELEKRPFLIDSSDEVTQASARYRATSDDVVVQWDFNDMEKNYLEVKIDGEFFAYLIDDAGFASLHRGQLEISECVGRDFSGEEIWVENVISVAEWVDANGNNDKDITQLFAPWLLRHGQHWLESLKLETA